MANKVPNKSPHLLCSSLPALLSGTCDGNDIPEGQRHGARGIEAFVHTGQTVRIYRF